MRHHMARCQVRAPLPISTYPKVMWLARYCILDGRVEERKEHRLKFECRLTSISEFAFADVALLNWRFNIDRPNIVFASILRKRAAEEWHVEKQADGEI